MQLPSQRGPEATHMRINTVSWHRMRIRVTAAKTREPVSICLEERKACIHLPPWLAFVRGVEITACAGLVVSHWVISDTIAGDTRLAWGAAGQLDYQDLIKFDLDLEICFSIIQCRLSHSTGNTGRLLDLAPVDQRSRCRRSAKNLVIPVLGLLYCASDAVDAFLPQ